jgi:hypothetical protein
MKTHTRKFHLVTLALLAVGATSCSAADQPNQTPGTSRALSAAYIGSDPGLADLWHAKGDIVFEGTDEEVLQKTLDVKAKLNELSALPGDGEVRFEIDGESFELPIEAVDQARSVLKTAVGDTGSSCGGLEPRVAPALECCWGWVGWCTYSDDPEDVGGYGCIWCCSVDGY